MTSYFTEAGYTENTVFKVINNEDFFAIGTLLTLNYDDETRCPQFKGKGLCSSYMYLPNMSEDCEHLEVVSLDGIKEGILDEDAKLLFTTYIEWVESEKCIVYCNTTPTYEVGEIVKIVGNSCNHGFDIGEGVRITELNKSGGRAEYLNDDDDWWMFKFKDIEKLPAETKEKEVQLNDLDTNETDVVKQQPTQTLRTPQDYHLMNSDDMIKIVVDGYEDEVKLGDLISITAVGGSCTGAYGYSLWRFLHETFGETITFDGTVFDIGKKQSELFDEYFLPRKYKELKEKLASKQKERKALDSEIQELQSELEKF